MIDRVLGGTGDGYDIDREFTELEAAILESILSENATHMQTAWYDYVEVESVLSGLETNARMLQTLSPDEIVVIIILTITVGDIKGNINLCIPATGLGELINNFNSKYQKISKRKIPDEEEAKQSMLGSILDSDLEVKAILDCITLDVQDVMRLQVDDVISLDKAIDSDICITVDDVPWFDGRLGEMKNKKAIKLNHLIAKNVNIEKRESNGDQ